MRQRTRDVHQSVARNRALREFLSTEVVGGLVLLAATAVALVWANSPWAGSYRRLWATDLSIALGEWSLVLDLRHWVNDGLMAFFFLVVGLEIKRELLEGELREPRRALLPVVAALGGMIVPAGVYLALNAGGDGARGWGIPVATDIAFALGVMALVGRRLPSSLRLFLLTLAIVDDIGAIVVIALFYSSGLAGWWLAAAGATLAVAYAVRQLGIIYSPVFVGFGVVLWLCLHEANVHATLAGVAMGLLVPVRAQLSQEDARSHGDELLDVSSPAAVRLTSQLARMSVSPLEWIEHVLHPWTSMLIVPLFALANAGVEISANALADAAASRVTLGVVLGLLVGKTVGISVFTWLACRFAGAELPVGAAWPQVVGTAVLAGIGFTVSLFVTSLAFEDPVLTDQAKMGILAASLVAGLLGSLVLVRAAPSGSADEP